MLPIGTLPTPTTSTATCCCCWGRQVADNDDDGEATSGQKLAGLLELMGANNVLVVVSRWFGGVHLGPARFKYLANTARELLDACGHGGERKSAGGGGPRTQKAPGDMKKKR